MRAIVLFFVGLGLLWLAVRFSADMAIRPEVLTFEYAAAWFVSGVGFFGAVICGVGSVIEGVKWIVEVFE